MNVTCANDPTIQLRSHQHNSYQHTVNLKSCRLHQHTPKRPADPSHAQKPPEPTYRTWKNTSIDNRTRSSPNRDTRATKWLLETTFFTKWLHRTTLFHQRTALNIFIYFSNPWPAFKYTSELNLYATVHCWTPTTHKQTTHSLPYMYFCVWLMLNQSKTAMKTRSTPLDHFICKSPTLFKALIRSWNPRFN